MTTSMIYWITRLDSIYQFIDGISILLTISSILLCITCICSFICREINRQYNRDEHIDCDFKTADILLRKIKLPTILTVILTMALNAGLTFVPTSKEMTAIYVIPKIASPETCKQLENISKDLLDITAKWLNDIKTNNTNK